MERVYLLTCSIHSHSLVELKTDQFLWVATASYILVFVPLEYQYHTQVNENGVLSFNAPFSASTPTSFFSFFLRSTSLIAPFWNDIDVINTFGNIWYRLTYDPQCLALATRLIVENAPVAPLGFNASYLLIATWERVGSLQFGSNEVCLWKMLAVRDTCSNTIGWKVIQLSIWIVSYWKKKLVYY